MQGIEVNVKIKCRKYGDGGLETHELSAVAGYVNLNGYIYWVDELLQAAQACAATIPAGKNEWP